MSHLGSIFWNGTVTNLYDNVGEQMNPDETSPPSLKYKMYTMPTTASVCIPGPTNAIVVIVDWNSPSSVPPIRLYGNTFLPLFVPDQVRPVAPIDIVPVWSANWTTNNINVVRSDLIHVTNEISRYSCTKYAVDRARTIVSDIHAALRPGIGIPARRWDHVVDDENDDLIGYSTIWNVHGGHILTSDGGDVPGTGYQIFKGTPWRVAGVRANDKPALLVLAEGFNFATLSASHGGIKNLQELDNDDRQKKKKKKASSTLSNFNCRDVVMKFLSRRNDQYKSPMLIFEYIGETEQENIFN